MGTNEDLVLKVRAEVDKATKEIKKLGTEIEALTKENKKFGASSKEIDGVNKRFDSLGKSLRGVAAAYLSLEGVKQLISTTAAIETGFIGVAKTTGLAGKELKALQDDILGLSTKLAGVSIGELQAVAESAGQLGIAGKENILTFTEVISKMGTATDLTAEEAAVAMAKLGNSLGIPVKQFENMGSVINELSNKTTATAKDLVDVGQRVAGAGKTFGLTASEIFGLSATLTDVGLSSEVAGTAISKLMINILTDTKGFADAVGLDFKEFSRQVEEEPVAAIQSFLGALGKLDKGARIQALTDLKMTGAGVAQTLLKVADNTDKLSTNLRIAGDEWVRNTSLEKEYQTSSKGIEAQYERAKNAVKKLSDSIGKTLLPQMKKMIDDFVRWSETLDKEKVEEFGKNIGSLAGSMGDLLSVLGFLNDIGMPDLLTWKKDSTVLSETALQIKNIADTIDVWEDALDSLFNASGQLEEQGLMYDNLAEKVKKFTGTSDDFDMLENALKQSIEAASKLHTEWSSSKNPEAYKEQIVGIENVLKGLGDKYTELTLKKPFEPTIESAQLASEAIKGLGDTTKKYTDDELKAINKLNETRVKDTERAIATIEKSEGKLAAEIVKINQKLMEDLTKIENDRFAMNQGIETKIADLKRGALADDAAYYDKQRAAEQALSDAKVALRAGEYEKYKSYIDQYESLVTDSAGQEIKVNEQVAVTKEETRKRAIDGLTKMQSLQNEFFDKQKADTQAAHDITIQQKKAELEATHALLIAQKEQLVVLKTIAEALTGKVITLDTTALDAAIAKTSSAKAHLDSLSATPGRVNVDSTPVDVAKQKVEQLKTVTLNGITLEVDADTDPADFGIKKLITNADGEEIVMDVNPEYQDAQKQLDAFRSGESSEDVVLGVNANTSAADAKIGTLKQPTNSEHTVKPNANGVISTINKLKQPTSSVHTIIERVVSARAGGGAVPNFKAPQKLATGGRFTGSGRVPGYDPTDSDKVNALLTGGEFVIKRKAVNAIGIPALNKLNSIVNSKNMPSMRVPKLPRFAEGGVFGGGSTKTSISGDMTPINLNIGGSSFQVMGEREIADALTKFINSEGGF